MTGVGTAAAAPLWTGLSGPAFDDPAAGPTRGGRYSIIRLVLGAALRLPVWLWVLGGTGSGEHDVEATGEASPRGAPASRPGTCDPVTTANTTPSYALCVSPPPPRADAAAFTPAPCELAEAVSAWEFSMSPLSASAVGPIWVQLPESEGSPPGFPADFSRSAGVKLPGLKP